MADQNKEKRYIFNPEMVLDNLANDEKIAEKAKNLVIKTFEYYEDMRNVTQGGVSYNLVDLWDELYRMYMCIRCDEDHNYDGDATVFMPVARRAVNIIDSEASNAFFSKEDYFSCDAVGQTDFNTARAVFNILMYYSNNENYVSQLELIKKQCEIYGCTVGESTYYKDYETYIERAIEEDKELGTKKKKLYKVEVEKHRPRIEARDIYRMYCNILTDDPSTEDVVYRDSLSAQRLLEMAELGAYNKEAVQRLIEKKPAGNLALIEKNTSGEGKTYVGSGFERDNDGYEVLRFQGLFTIDNEDDGTKIKKQFWIDIGERTEVLRVIENPLIDKDKTFTFTNYDTMIGEFCTDGIIAPIRSLNYEINDKENQSLDALSFGLNAPFEVVKGAGLVESDLNDIYKTKHKPLFVRERDSIRKIQNPVDVGHLNNDITRLNAYADNTTGATSIASGAPSGTQADRSGKAIGLLQNQTRSQFSKFIRKFEKNMIEKSLQKIWNMIYQFSDDEIEIKLEQEGSVFKQKVSDIVGKFNVRVSSGSEYLKEKEMRDSIMEFIAILNTNDTFMMMVDRETMLKDIAAYSPYNMVKYVKPDNLYNQMKQQVDQLTAQVDASNKQIALYGGEVNRLNGELKQTNRSMMSTSPTNSDPTGQAEDNLGDFSAQ